MTPAERVEFFKAFHQQTCEIQSAITTGVCMSPNGAEIVRRFQQQGDIKQAEEINLGLKSMELLMAKATMMDVNVICQLLDKFARMMGDKDIEEAMAQIDAEIQERKINKLYETDE